MKSLRKVVSLTLVSLFTVFTVLSYTPVQASVKVAKPQIKLVKQPDKEYQVGQKVSLQVNAPNYSGKVQYRIILWDVNKRVQREYWPKDPGYYSKQYQNGKSTFTVSWPINEPGMYNITVLAKIAGAKVSYDTYVKTINFTVKQKTPAVSASIPDKKVTTSKPDKESPYTSVGNDVKITSDNFTYSNARVEGDLYISANNVAINDVNVKGTVFIDPGKNGNATLNNVVAGSIKVLSGGINSIHLSNVDSQNLLIESDSTVRVEATGTTSIDNTTVTSYAILDANGGKLGEVVVKMNEQGNFEVELRGTFSEPVIVETDATIKAAENADISKLEVAPANGGTVKLEGTFKDVAVTQQSTLEVGENAKITNGLKVETSAEVKAAETSSIAKVDVAPVNGGTVKLQGNFERIELNAQANIEVGANSIITDVKVNSVGNIKLDDTAAIRNVEKANDIVETSNGKFENQPVNNTPSTGGGGGDNSERPTVSVRAIKSSLSISVFILGNGAVSGEDYDARTNISNPNSATLSFTSDNPNVTVNPNTGVITVLAPGAEAKITVNATKTGWSSSTAEFTVKADKANVDSSLGLSTAIANQNITTINVQGSNVLLALSDNIDLRGKTILGDLLVSGTGTISNGTIRGNITVDSANVIGDKETLDLDGSKITLIKDAARSEVDVTFARMDLNSISAEFAIKKSFSLKDLKEIKWELFSEDRLVARSFATDETFKLDPSITNISCPFKYPEVSDKYWNYSQSWNGADLAKAVLTLTRIDGTVYIIEQQGFTRDSVRTVTSYEELLSAAKDRGVKYIYIGGNGKLDITLDQNIDLKGRIVIGDLILSKENLTIASNILAAQQIPGYFEISNGTIRGNITIKSSNIFIDEKTVNIEGGKITFVEEAANALIGVTFARLDYDNLSVEFALKDIPISEVSKVKWEVFDGDVPVVSSQAKKATLDLLVKYGHTNISCPFNIPEQDDGYWSYTGTLKDRISEPKAVLTITCGDKYVFIVEREGFTRDSVMTVDNQVDLKAALKAKRVKTIYIDGGAELDPKERYDINLNLDVYEGTGSEENLDLNGRTIIGNLITRGDGVPCNGTVRGNITVVWAAPENVDAVLFTVNVPDENTVTFEDKAARALINPVTVLGRMDYNWISAEFSLRKGPASLQYLEKVQWELFDEKDELLAESEATKATLNLPPYTTNISCPFKNPQVTDGYWTYGKQWDGTKPSKAVLTLKIFNNHILKIEQNGLTRDSIRVVETLDDLKSALKDRGVKFIEVKKDAEGAPGTLELTSLADPKDFNNLRGRTIIGNLILSGSNSLENGTIRGNVTITSASSQIQEGTVVVEGTVTYLGDAAKQALLNKPLTFERLDFSNLQASAFINLDNYKIYNYTKVEWQVFDGESLIAKSSSTQALLNTLNGTKHYLAVGDSGGPAKADLTCRFINPQSPDQNWNFEKNWDGKKPTRAVLTVEREGKYVYVFEQNSLTKDTIKTIDNTAGQYTIDNFKTDLKDPALKFIEIVGRPLELQIDEAIDLNQITIVGDMILSGSNHLDNGNISGNVTFKSAESINATDSVDIEEGKTIRFEGDASSAVLAPVTMEFRRSDYNNISIGYKFNQESIVMGAINALAAGIQKLGKPDIQSGVKLEMYDAANKLIAGSTATQALMEQSNGWLEYWPEEAVCNFNYPKQETDGYWNFEPNWNGDRPAKAVITLTAKEYYNFEVVYEDDSLVDAIRVVNNKEELKAAIQDSDVKFIEAFGGQINLEMGDQLGNEEILDFGGRILVGDLTLSGKGVVYNVDVDGNVTVTTPYVWFDGTLHVKEGKNIIYKGEDIKEVIPITFARMNENYISTEFSLKNFAPVRLFSEIKWEMFDGNNLVASSTAKQPTLKLDPRISNISCPFKIPQGEDDGYWSYDKLWDGTQPTRAVLTLTTDIDILGTSIVFIIEQQGFTRDSMPTVSSFDEFKAALKAPGVKKIIVQGGQLDVTLNQNLNFKGRTVIGNLTLSGKGTISNGTVVGNITVKSADVTVDGSVNIEGQVINDIPTVLVPLMMQVVPVAPPVEVIMPEVPATPPVDGTIPTDAVTPPVDGTTPTDAVTPPVDGTTPTDAVTPPVDGTIPTDAMTPPAVETAPTTPVTPPPADKSNPENPPVVETPQSEAVTQPDKANSPTDENTEQSVDQGGSQSDEANNGIVGQETPQN